MTAARPQRVAPAAPYRMKDLVELTGVPRQVIHFYIQKGLLPPGEKRGRNLAFYGPEHVERLRLVRRLQHERFLPLKAIKAVLDDRIETFTPAQRQLLAGLKQYLATPLGMPERPSAEPLEALVARTGVDEATVRHMIEHGYLGATEDDEGRTLVSRDDAWLVEMWSEMTRLGFSRAIGFRVEDLQPYDEVVDRLIEIEASFITRLGDLPPEAVAAMVEKALPLVHAFLARLHVARLRDLFASMEGV